jgi:hypothetical protein
MTSPSHLDCGSKIETCAMGSMGVSLLLAEESGKSHFRCAAAKLRMLCSNFNQIYMYVGIYNTDSLRERSQ